MDEGEKMITMQDFRDAGMCVVGVRDWMVDRNLDFKGFVKNGLPESEVRRIAGDHLADQILAKRGDA